MKSINVSTSSKKYCIYLGKGILCEVGKIVKTLSFSGKIMIVTDDCVSELYLDQVKNSLISAGYDTSYIVLPNGEENKNMDNILKIYEALQQSNINRNGMIVALGGGVVGDMAGFAAATYLRGIKYIQVPTTLLAQVDSSIGGKTGIDLEFGKNLVGAFLQPEAVIADTDTIKTLDDKNIACGMAEVIKSAFIRDLDFVEMLEKSQDFYSDIDKFIIRTINIKKEIVEIDEFEKRERMLLNFGHTLGHSIEKLLNYTGITHGQAVAIGMTIITNNKSVKERLKNLLHKYNLSTQIDIPVKDIVEAAFNDKKAVDDGINIIVVDKIGEAEIKKLTFEEFYKIYG